jgi:hypothetical protein
MWLGLFAIIIAVLCVGLSIVSAGAFTLVLIFVAVLAAIGAGVSLFGARRLGVGAVTKVDAGVTETVTRYGHESESGPNREPATPEEHLKARRAA